MLGWIPQEARQRVRGIFSGKSQPAGVGTSHLMPEDLPFQIAVSTVSTHGVVSSFDRLRTSCCVRVCWLLNGSLMRSKALEISKTIGLRVNAMQKY
jgi:hypothetical protein